MIKYKTEIKWTFIYAAMFLLWMSFEKLAGFHDKRLEQQQFVSMLILIPSIIIYSKALLDKKKSFYSGVINYKQSFMSGLALTLFIVLLSPVNQVITSYIITPDYFANIIKYTVQSGVYTQEQAEAQYNIKNYLVSSIIGGLITGGVFSAVISLFIKSKKHTYEQ
ncbi:hypothetical protein Phep_2768 [Sporocytophaga myxococcoides]|uniref:DUF4199 domain-containing protein n=1 Tax=Sporocytophaga myxococcoides TaxID=153721 RepID=A0A098LI29_9BACT|nr:DUF4199 domain-containing protein [Sporocytophaga myxococcoides]GAL86119.1 hypothetical protein Phep_2768 [Sporocytophaga myxococcoides]